MVTKKEYWNKSQLRYKDCIEPSNYVKEFEEKIKPKSKILELGGARGNDSIYLYNKNHIPTIIDISDLAQKLTAERNPNIKYIVQNLSNTPYSLNAQSYDYIYSRLAIQYFNKEETIKIYKEIMRLLKPNGEAHIIVKSSKDKKEMEKIKEYEQIEPGVYKGEDEIISRFNWHQIRQILNSAGINNYTIRDTEEKLVAKNKYGHNELLVTEIILKKV